MNSIKAFPQSPISPDVKTDSASPRDSKMKEAARDFENQFLRKVITEMRKTVPKDDLVGESMAEDIFKDQLDDHYADMWADQGGVGLADVIYQQLQDRYGTPTILPRAQGEYLKLPARAPIDPTGVKAAGTALQVPVDIFDKGDMSLFMAKKVVGGFDIRSREPLPERVNIRSPLPGVVLQTSRLEDGRQLIIIRHDEGLVSQIVHSGDTRVKSNVRVLAGEIIADLPSSKKGESANVFFGLRKTGSFE